MVVLQEIDQTVRMMETRAGMARVELARACPEQALIHVEDIWSVLQHTPPISADEPFRLFLTCYQVFQANQDTRASTVLRTACALLHECAASISDAHHRHSFLHNVPYSRALLQALAAEQALTAAQQDDSADTE
jgi:hypothetical protein